ncbi:MAG TPA: hypothetical protein VKT53_12730 [Candidatus Acidoferrum sp.]|nr:hypothetical protein [Candidatus Acidoferrum sp.]
MTVTLVESDFAASACEIAATLIVVVGTAAGAVYRPPALIVPVAAPPPVTPFTCHVTAVLVVFVTVAVNCSVLLTCTEGVFGLMATPTGGGAVTVTVAFPVLVVSACEVAVTVTVPPVGTFAGAVYRPVALIVPMLAAPADGLLICHVTAVFAVPVTVAVNCCVLPVCTLGIGGVTDTTIGGGVMVVPPGPAQPAANTAAKIRIE